MWTLNSLLNKYSPATLRVLQHFTFMEWVGMIIALILILWFID